MPKRSAVSVSTGLASAPAFTKIENPISNDSVTVSNHPVLKHKMTLLRDIDTSTKDYRQLMKEVSFYLAYEATSKLELQSKKVMSSKGSYEGDKLAAKVAVVPILRGGLSMMDPLLELLPNSAVYHIGMYKGSHNLPIQYYNRLPRKCQCEHTFLVDPVIGTAATLIATCTILKKWGTKKITIISVVGTQQGLQNLMEKHPDVEVCVGAVDEEDGPGIGDCGNRLYHIDFEEEEEVQQAKKQKK